MITVEAKMDRCGNITVAPVSRAWRERFARIVRENGGADSRELSDYETAFFQEGMGSAEFLENDVPSRKRRELEQGYTVRFRADPWIVGHWYGYDAHTAAE